MQANEIETTIGTYAISAQPAFASPNRHLPGSLKAYRHSLCLPLHSRMTATDVEEVVDCLLAGHRMRECPWL